MSASGMRLSSLLLLLLSICTLVRQSSCDSLKFKPHKVDVSKVHVIYMNHLDVGYDGIPATGYINNVLNTYFTQYFPRAVALAEALRTMGYQETFIYTTHPWLVSLYTDCPPNLVLSGVQLKCPNATELSSFSKAVTRGDITWHAGPMNMQPEVIDTWLFEFGLNVSKDLDRAFGFSRKFRTLSQRDVPGMTQAVLPYLVKNGIAGISVGVNDMTSPPAVPHDTPFIWRYGNSEVIAMWHPGGYPDNPGPFPAQPGGLSADQCVHRDDFDEVLCFAFRTDNSGPPLGVQEIINYYEILRVQFPGAKIFASTFENYVEALQPIKDRLPVVTKEISDTWIQGIASDPRKVAEMKVASSQMDACLKSGVCRMSDGRVYNASRFLLKLGEHTWGLPSVADNVNWTNTAFQKARIRGYYPKCESAWSEQRNMTYIALEALGDHPVVAKIQGALQGLQAKMPDLTGFKKVTDPAQVFQCATFNLGFNKEGAVTTLMDKKTKINWASDKNELGKFLYITYNQTDFDVFGKRYNYHGHSAGFYKNNVTKNAHPESRTWPTILKNIYSNANGGKCDLFVNLQLADKLAVSYYGAPADVWVRYTETPGEQHALKIGFQWFDKTTTRLPEALMFQFEPVPQPGNKWILSKLGQKVDPTNVILNGSQHQHVVDSGGVAYMSLEGSGLRMSSDAVSLVSPVTNIDGATAFPAPLEPLASDITGFAFNFYNNIWDTNYILWYPYVEKDKDFKASFYVSF